MMVICWALFKVEPPPSRGDTKNSSVRVEFLLTSIVCTRNLKIHEQLKKVDYFSIMGHSTFISKKLNTQSSLCSNIIRHAHIILIVNQNDTFSQPDFRYCHVHIFKCLNFSLNALKVCLSSDTNPNFAHGTPLINW